MTVSGVGDHNMAVLLAPRQTLIVRIAWVDVLANPALTMSSDMQLAVADRMVASIDPGP